MAKHVYSTPYGGREIYRDGKPFALITSAIDIDRAGPNWDPVALSEFGHMAAAAPEMFEALEMILAPSPHYAATQAHRDRIAEARAKGLAALAKARGEG